MPLVHQPCSRQRFLVSLSFAALTAGLFSIVVLFKDAALHSDLQSAKVLALEKDQALENALREAESKRAQLEAALRLEMEEKKRLEFQTQTAVSAAKVAGGVMLCTVLWDLSALAGNPFAVPGITDNAVCGAVTSMLGLMLSPGRRASSKADTAHPRVEGAAAAAPT